MENCCKLVHPFQNDSGVSQQQRMVKELLAGAPKIDGRSMADLLNYFRQLSKNINFYYYEEGQDQLMVNDWSTFFEKSTPFLLSSIIKFEKTRINKRLEKYNKLFKKKPSKQGLQLILHYIFHQTISPINDWSIELKDSQLSIKTILEKLIRDKLNKKVRDFICFTNTAVQQFNIRRIDFGKLRDNPLWDFKQDKNPCPPDCFEFKDKSRRKKLLELRKAIMDLVPSIFEATKVAGTSAELVLNDSFEPMKDEFRQKTPPHLALIFAFLKIFGYLQDDLNSFTKKHLEFFYKDVLKLRALDAIPDKAHILFEIQNQLDKYKLAKGLKLKAGKDENKEEILFSLDDEIVVNKATVADVKTLFVNNRPFYNTQYIEGVYMAPDATKADGIKIDFKEEDLKSWPALGAKFSKYVDPDTNLFRQYPNARLGFVLASPVLYLQEGKRTIDVTIACELDKNFCDKIADPEPDKTDKCCDRLGQPIAMFLRLPGAPQVLPYVPPKKFLEQVADALKTKYYHIYLPSIPAALKDLKKNLRTVLKDAKKANKTNKEFEKRVCYCPEDVTDQVIQLKEDDWKPILAAFSEADKAILNSLFKPKNLLKVVLSGEKEWIEPSNITPIELRTDGDSFQLALQFTITLEIDKPAVTFFDGAALKEEIKTEWPVLKVELDDSIKMERTEAELLGFLDDAEAEANCCIGKKPLQNHDLSFYHFFRNLIVVKEASVPGFTPLFKTGIDVTVCGLTKFTVQNDESLQDVNGPIFPFGTRPEVIDFNVINPSYCLTTALINDAPISGPAKAILNGKLGTQTRIRVGKQAIGKFLEALAIVDPEKTNFINFLDTTTTNYCGKNLIGPNFYVGSKEVFCKKWTEVFINYNWKNRPSDFRDYYKAYVAKKQQGSNTLIYGLDKDEFQINLSVLDDGKWIGEDLHTVPPPPPPTADVTVTNPTTTTNNRKLFPDPPATTFCTVLNPFEQTFHIKNNYFTLNTPEFCIDRNELGPYTASTQEGFLRITLQNQDFLHKNYPYVLARQMMALGMQSTDPPGRMEDAVYYDENGNIIVFSSQAIRADVEAAEPLSIKVRDAINLNPGGIMQLAGNPGSGDIASGNAENIRTIIFPPVPIIFPNRKNLTGDVEDLKTKIANIKKAISDSKAFQAIIPNEPWTPVIKNIAIDYKATALIEDIDLIHLHPYKDTYKEVDIENQPALFPTFCDEGNLFIGLKNLVPGSNVNMLFQLSEATADSELAPVDVRWYFLQNNVWRRLRTGFEILSDETLNLSTSGIIKFAMPEAMTKDNTILPKEWHWIRASIEKNSRQVCEIIGIHTQAVKAIFEPVPANDVLRLSQPLEKKKINALEQPDSSIKKIEQPYETFGGDVPEMEGKFFIRVSELLRHKGRAIQKWDYERIILQKFPQIYKAKCITHSFGLDANKYDNDFPMAPGYVLLAVIPDLRILKAAQSFQPKAPLSLLERIEAELKTRTSPFVRLRVMNPRYEKVNFCIRVQLVVGKDEIYYKEKLAQDIREFMAPWAIGEFHKLHFGQCVNRTDIIQFLETLDYVDFIMELRMGHERDAEPSKDIYSICPHTPRSILIAGEVDVCIPDPKCITQDGACENPPIKVVDYCRDIILRPNG